MIADEHITISGNLRMKTKKLAMNVGMKIKPHFQTENINLIKFED
jgi:nitrate/nitrite-specific signal transduction histidine kinase